MSIDARCIITSGAVTTLMSIFSCPSNYSFFFLKSLLEVLITWIVSPVLDPGVYSYVYPGYTLMYIQWARLLLVTTSARCMMACGYRFNSYVYLTVPMYILITWVCSSVPEKIDNTLMYNYLSGMVGLDFYYPLFRWLWGQLSFSYANVGTTLLSVCGAPKGLLI